MPEELFARADDKQEKTARLTREMLAELQKHEGFPMGEDSAIINLSAPPVYTACPNPFVREFIREHGRPYCPGEDGYHREPFAFDVKEGRSGSIYNAHAYHTKVPYKAIMRYILHYTDPGDIVLDGFCGTGMTGVAAGMCGDPRALSSLGYRVLPDGTVLDEQKNPFSKLGKRHAVLADLSPAASFIAHNYNAPLSGKAFVREARRILAEVEEECGWMYETRHVQDGKEKRGSDGRPIRGKVNYTIWSDVFICPHCSGRVVFWKAAVDRVQGRVKREFSCPHCRAVLTKRSLERAGKRVYDRDLNQTITRAEMVPVLINYTVGKNRFEKEPDEGDLKPLERIEESEIPYWYPTLRMPEGDEARRNDEAGITHAHHFYTRRNLWVLAALNAKIDLVRGPLRHRLRFLAQSYSFVHSTVMSRIIFKAGKKPVLTGNQSGTLYISSLPVEKNILEGLTAKVSLISKALGGIRADNVVTTQSTTDLWNVGDNTVDYVFTDPPFGSNLMYSELNFLWEAWFGVFTNNEPEAVENKSQAKGLSEYQELMERCFGEYHRVLKPGRWMTVVFHNSQNRVWNALQEAIMRAGFVIADVRTMDKKQGSFKQVNSAGAVKQDLVISAYKPTNDFENRFTLKAGTENGAWEFIRNHLKHLPIFLSDGYTVQLVEERQKHLLFDRMVAFHVLRGVSVPLNAGEFYAGLDQRFPKRDGMYFLPDQVSEYDQKRLEAKGPEQLSLFLNDERSAIQWLRGQLEKEPQTFQEIQPKFLKELHKANHEELPELSDLLEENFLQDDEGRWYVPDPNKQSDLEKLRDKTLMKVFEEYKTGKGRLKQFRTEALRAGFKACWSNRDYATIVQVAERIPDKVLHEDSSLLMYYDNARMRLNN